MKTGRKNHGALVQRISYDVANHSEFHMPELKLVPSSLNLRVWQIWDPLQRSRGKPARTGAGRRSPLLESVGRGGPGPMARLLGVGKLIAGERFGYDKAEQVMHVPPSSWLALEAYGRVFGTQIEGYGDVFQTIAQGGELREGWTTQQTAHALMVAHLINHGVDGIFHNLALKTSTGYKLIMAGIEAAEVAGEVVRVQKTLMDAIGEGAITVEP